MHGKLGILFLHHTRNDVTLHNLELIRQRHPGAVVATMSANEPLQDGYTLNNTPSLKRLHSQLPQRREDSLVCSWFLQKKEQCDKWWIVEWDVFCEVSVFDYYKSVWNYPFVASTVCLRYRDLHWYWFQKLDGTPEEYVPYIIGALPFLFLLSEPALEATCRMLLDHPFTSANSEVRFATAANRSGYAPCGFSPPNDRMICQPWKRLEGPPAIFHPVKHHVDYR